MKATRPHFLEMPQNAVLSQAIVVQLLQFLYRHFDCHLSVNRMREPPIPPNDLRAIPVVIQRRLIDLRRKHQKQGVFSDASTLERNVVSDELNCARTDLK